MERASEADQHGGAPAQRDDEQGDQNGERRAAIASSAIVAFGAMRREAERKIPATDRQIGDEGENAGEDHGDHEKLNVAVANVGQFMREDRLELGVGQIPRQTASHRDLVPSLFEPGSVGVERVALDDLQGGNRHAAGDAEIFEQIV